MLAANVSRCILQEAVSFHAKAPMLNFGLVGCGRIAGRHAGLLADGLIKGARLAAVCDNQPDRAKAFGTRYQVPSYTDMNEMMHKEPIHVVSVLTPSGFHAEHVIQ